MGLEHGELCWCKKEQEEDRGEGRGMDNKQTSELDPTFLISEEHLESKRDEERYLSPFIDITKNVHAQLLCGV